MLFLLFLVGQARLASAGLVDNGTVVTLDDIPYYAGGAPVAQLGSECTRRAKLADAVIPGHDLFPMTIVEAPSTDFHPEELLNLTAQYEAEDDVFQRGFLRSIYLSFADPGLSHFNASAFAGTLSKLNTAVLMSSARVFDENSVAVTEGISKTIPKGPYFVSALTGNVYKAHRLYPDDYLAFIQGVLGDEKGAFTSLPAVTENVMAKSIAVPSRLYYTVSDKQPLAGLRLGVKDIFHVKGIATSGGNRAYFYLYGTQNETAPSIQRLIDLGAVLVGKMGTVQFANGDRPTADWVDLHAPFNPRGEGYQDPSGSSTGPGAGIGAYDWLDLAVGSDTGGSMRGPAGAVGIFGNRPSTGAISMDHVIPLSPVSDTAGVFSRSGATWAKTVQAWYPNFATNFTAYPRDIYRAVAVGGWNSGNVSEDASVLIESFMSGLQGFLETKTTLVNYTARWEESHGDAPANVADMLYLTYGVFITHDQWTLHGKPFFEDYAAKYDGRRPFVNPGPLVRWQWGQENATEDTYAQALHNVSTFKTWWETDGYGQHDAESCSKGLYVYIWGIGEPSYRNVYTTAPTGPPLGFDDSSIPVMAGVPEVIVPIGEVTYNSTVSLKTEYLPVSMGLRMARGCDHVLASLVADLEETGILRSVAAGTRLYP